MNKEYFADNLSIEDMAEMTDKMLRFEKIQKTKKRKSDILKLIPAAAAIALIIGVVNLLPVLFNDTGIDNRQGAGMITNNPAKEIELFVPWIIEKTFFEENILAVMPAGRDREIMEAYYTLGKTGYALDSNISNREAGILLGYLLEYTDLTGNDMMQMILANDLPLENPNPPADPQPDITVYESLPMIDDMPVIRNITDLDHAANPYANVNFDNVIFGETEDILLLEVEWHTAETYLEEYIQRWEEMGLPDREIGERIDSWLSERLDAIRNGIWYSSRYINGKRQEINVGATIGAAHGIEDISEFFDENGYFVFSAYPTHIYINYDNYERQKIFCCEPTDDGGIEMCGGVNSKNDFDRLLEEKIRPYCDDLWIKGIITQEEYFKFTTDPLTYFAAEWFN